MMGKFYNPKEMTYDELISLKVELETAIDLYQDKNQISKANQVQNNLKLVKDELKSRSNDIVNI
jgi:hypothetical protein